MTALPKQLNAIKKLPPNTLFFREGKPDKEHIFFGESVYYLADSQEEKENATLYLNLWKIFLARKLCNELEEYELIDEQWVERPPEYTGCFNLYSTLALKMAFKKRLPSEIT